MHELTTLIDSMELTDGDPAFTQLGGPYSQVKKQLTGTKYEAHHIPPQSVFAEGLRDKLPTVAITKDDHGRTSSYRGRMGAKKEPLLPGGPPPQKHKDLVLDALNQGFLPEMVRNEVYEFRRDYGTRYDGGLKQYIEAMIEFVKTNGVPATRAK